MSAPVPEPIAGLIRDHRAIEAAVGEARSTVSAATASPDDLGLTTDALTQLYLLQDLLEHEVTVHIAKEEQALFPVLSNAAPETSALIEDMLAEHDQVRAKQQVLNQYLASLDHHHGPVSVGTMHEEEGPDEVVQAKLPELLVHLRDTVIHLDWLLQGHFTGEEDGLFQSAAEVLSRETLNALIERMAEVGKAAGQSTDG